MSWVTVVWSMAASASLTLAGLPPEVPVIGKSQEADVKFTRWVFLIGYLFGR